LSVCIFLLWPGVVITATVYLLTVIAAFNVFVVLQGNFTWVLLFILVNYFVLSVNWIQWFICLW